MLLWLSDATIPKMCCQGNSRAVSRFLSLFFHYYFWVPVHSFTAACINLFFCYILALSLSQLYCTIITPKINNNNNFCPLNYQISIKTETKRKSAAIVVHHPNRYLHLALKKSLSSFHGTISIPSSLLIMLFLLDIHNQSEGR